MRMMTGAKRALKRALVGCGGMRWAQKIARPRVAILRYHSIKDDPPRHADSIGEGIIHSTSLFKQQMEALARNFDPVTLDDVVQFLQQGRGLPPRPVVVTFDDGYADNAEIAAPIMDRLGIKAAFYVTVGPLESGTAPWFCRLRHAFATTPAATWADSEEGNSKPLTDVGKRRAAFLAACERCASRIGDDQEETTRRIEQELSSSPLNGKERMMMTWDQARALGRTGHIIGSHTISHPNVAQLDERDSEREIKESRARLEGELKVPVLHFSYPHPILDPHWTPSTLELTRQAGYRTAVTTAAGPVQVGDDPLALRRVAVPHDLQEFWWSVWCTLLGRRL
jgi:peptidoglycan/xylan/chitin deacetylase (PgdA/CDA1 family)